MKTQSLLTALSLCFGTLPNLPAQEPPAKPTPNRADEPLAAKLSLSRAGAFLDGAALAWHQDRKCASCHTTYPYVLARPLIGESATFDQLRGYLRDRVAKWDDGGKGVGMFDGSEGVTEVVSIAATLAMDDARANGRLHPATRKALKRMWELQAEDGAWTWNQHRLPPQEFDDYYGALYAALGVGQAPENYAQSAAAKPGLDRLRGYFKKNPSPNLHHKTLLVWASTRLDGLMTPAERAATVKELLALQRKDGGWNLPSLGDWKRHNGQPNDKEAASDGYATGLVIYVLRQTGMAKGDDAIRRGVRWLETNQRESGRWFTRSVSADRAHYNTVAGTCYAVMALKACE